MPVLTVITLLSLIMENSGSSARYVATSSPNWKHIYTGDPVTLTCDIGPDKNSNNFYWYKDNKGINQRKQEFTIRYAKTSDSGVYECWMGSGDRSHPLTIYVIQKDLKNRPTVTFTPNYRNIFAGEKMTISCEDRSYATRNQIHFWYKDNEILDTHRNFITINNAKTDDSGEYRCEKGGGASYPLRLHVHPIYDEVILQTPPNILEGDPLDVRCHSYPPHSNKEETTTFYKGGDIIQKSNQIPHLENVTKSTTGIYRCEKIILNKITTSEERFLLVQDLFTRPKIITPSYIKEGDAMTLRCDTRRNPLIEDTKLTFTFYRNGETVQEPGPSDTYEVKLVQLEDSGNYSCEVRTPSDTVMKKSEVSYIYIRELFMKPEIQIHPQRVQEGDRVTISCLQNPKRYGSLFTFYRDAQSVQIAYTMQYVIPYASEEHTGKYKCSVTYGGISKNSSEIMVRVQIAVDEPILTLSPNMVAVGDDAVLRCESSKGSAPIYYLFYHNQTSLGNITVHQKGAAELQLTITSLTMGGLYSCASYNDFQTQPQRSEEADLLVIEPVSDVHIIADREGEEFIMGDPLTLTCSARRGTNISVFWLHNGTVVETSSDLYDLKDYGKVLYIAYLQYDHKGTYRCNARNGISHNRTFSVLSEVLNVLEAGPTGGGPPWLMFGILLVVLVLLVFLFLLYRKNILSSGYCHKDRPSAGIVQGPENTLPVQVPNAPLLPLVHLGGSVQNNENIDRRNTPTAQEEVYENVTMRENLEDEDEGYTYITVRTQQASSPASAAATKEDTTVVYAMVKKSAAVSSETNRDERNPDTPDSAYQFENPIYN